MSERTHQTRTGVLLIVAAFLLPVLAYFGAMPALRLVSRIDPVPNQGAMMWAMLAPFWSLAGAAALLIAGIVVLVRSRLVRN